MRRHRMAIRSVIVAMAVGSAFALQAAETRRPTPKIDEGQFRAPIAETVALMKARRFAEVAGKVDPIDRAYTEAYRNGPRAYCSRGAPESMLEMLQAHDERSDAVAISPTWCEALYMRAYAAVELGRPGDAARDLDRILKMAPFHSRYLSERADLMLRSRQFEAAIPVFRKAEQQADLIEKGDAAREQRVRACRGVGYALIELGRLDDAEANYNRCLTIAPGDKKSIDELAYIARQRAKGK